MPTSPTAILPDIVTMSVVELVGINDAVAASQYTNSADLGLPYNMSGEIVSVSLHSTEDGSGAVQQVNGDVIFISTTNPSVSAGDTALTAAEWLTVVGVAKVTSADWVADTGGGVAFVMTAIPFEEVTAPIYAVMKFDASSAMNDAGGDDEQLELRVRIRKG